MNNPKPRAPAVQRAFKVLTTVAAARRPLSLAELAGETGTPKSSVLGICVALTNAGLLIRGHDGTYALGPRTVEFGAASHRSRPGVRRIGVTTLSLQRAFYRAEVEAIRAEASTLDAEVHHVETSSDVHNQAACVRGLIDWGADLIIVDPVEVDGLEGAYAEAARRAIPVVSINGASTGADAAVTTDNAQAGMLSAEFILRELGYSGTVAIVDGTSVTAVVDRVNGFMETLRPHRDVRIVSHLYGDNTEPAGYRTMTRMLADGSLPDAVFAINDPTAVGAARACREAGISPVIVGVDGSTAALAEIAGSGLIAASAAQDPYELGRRGVQLGLGLNRGSSLRQSTILLPTTLITRERLDGYTAWDEAA